MIIFGGHFDIRRLGFAMIDLRTKFEVSRQPKIAKYGNLEYSESL